MYSIPIKRYYLVLVFASAISLIENARILDDFGNHFRNKHKMISSVINILYGMYLQYSKHSLIQLHITIVKYLIQSHRFNDKIIIFQFIETLIFFIFTTNGI